MTASRSSVMLRNLVPSTASAGLAAWRAVGIVEAISLHKITRHAFNVVKLRSLIYSSIMLPLSRIRKHYCLGGHLPLVSGNW